jgi:signal transduction histidine kinase
VDDVALVQHVPLFAGLAPEEIAGLIASAERVTFKAGDCVIREGDPGNTMYVILSGELEVTKRDNDRQIVLATRRPGEFLGEMSLLEGAPRGATVRAVRDSELLSIGPEAFHQLIESRPSTATTVLRTVASRLRSTEASLVQSEKLASLGTLAAGLAHELNNPAAAIQRSTGYLREAFEAWRRRTVELHALEMSATERTRLTELEQGIKSCGQSRSDATTRKEESRIEARLDELGVAEPWELAPSLAAYGWSVERIDPLTTDFSAAHLPAVLQWLGAGLAAQQLVEEIQRSSKAISDIVRAVKSYAYLDQAKVQDVDPATALEDTLMILHHKLKHGIEVVRDFAADVPRIEAYAGEINQVLTNIIDNAIQAMDGKGKLELSVRRLGEEVEIRIADSGPGIPPEIAQRVFDPFFTTKPQGVGTGLGLHIAHNIIVNRHRGRIDFDSHPGRTEFKIGLPLKLKAVAPETKSDGTERKEHTEPTNGKR